MEGEGIYSTRSRELIKISHVQTHECTNCRHIFTRTLTSNICKCTKCRQRVCLNDSNTTNPTEPVTSMPKSTKNIIHPKTNPNANQGNHSIK